MQSHTVTRINATVKAARDTILPVLRHRVRSGLGAVDGGGSMLLLVVVAVADVVAGGGAVSGGGMSGGGRGEARRHGMV